MARSRVARRGNKRERNKKNITWLTATIAAVGITAIAAATALGINAARSAAVDAQSVQISDEILSASTSADLTPTVAPDAATSLIEVPDVCGMPLEEAETLLAVAGFSVLRVSTPAGDATAGIVLAQEPEKGSKISAGSDVSLIYADPDGVEEQTGATTLNTAADSNATGIVVCIDPGHQVRANLDTEPVGPGSKDMKPKVTGGATGAVTRQPEYRLALAISKKVQERLEAKGVTVVMTRVNDAVDISNRQRAEVANKAGAALFVRIHADGSTNGDTKGISTLYPGGNSWVAPIEARSLRAAKIIQKSVLATTQAQDRGLSERGDIAGFNWSKVPSVLVETGFLSNPVEDKLLAEEGYQDKIASGIAAGILEYLGL